MHLETGFSNLKAFKHYAGKNIYKMRTRLTRDTMEIFPLDHLHYESFLPELNDGPDIVDMVDELRLARKEIDAAMDIDREPCGRTTKFFTEAG